MFMSQKRIFPRWKEWKPLATQQFRLRNIIQIIGLNIGAEDLEGKICGTSAANGISSVAYYYTLHLTAMSAPFYTSEKLESNCPKWNEVDGNMWSDLEVFGGIQAFVLRLWCHNSRNDCDEVLIVWGVHLTGLVYLGPYLRSGSLPLSPNTIVFVMPGGYYTNPVHVNEPNKLQIASAAVAKEELRLSYSLSKVYNLSAVQQKIRQKATGVDAIKLKISTGDFLTSDSRGSAMLRRLLNKNKPKSNHLDVVKLKETVEVAKYRIQTLQDERNRVLARIASCRGRLEALADKNQIKESQTMEKYRLLQREVQAHREWLAGHVQRREAQLHAKALLNFRIKQLISELHFIYPVEQVGDKFTICGVHLPDSESLTGSDELQISVGLGFVAHSVQMISVFLQVPLRYPVIHVGSRSLIVDMIADKMPDTEREFPLFCKGKDKLQFNYAVYLLNKNVAALRWLCGLSTYDLRSTLPNLAALLRLSGAELPTEPALRSPASSTFDLASSLSISSPVQSNFPPRHLYRHPVSESAADSLSNAAPTFQMVQSVHGFGNSSAFQNTNFRVPPALDAAASLVSNFSYSLDKGLNEFEELKRKVNSKWPETEKTLGVAPSALGGSDSNLPVCLSREHSAKDLLCIAEDAASSSFLKNWEADKTNVIYSDEDSDHNNSGIFVEKTVCSLEHSLNEQECTLTSERRGDGDQVSLGLEACDESHCGASGIIYGQSSRQEIDDLEPEASLTNLAENSSELKLKNRNVEVSSTDTLLDNVTNRTELLANQSSSFNMCRSRFRSTLGSTN